MPAISQVQEKVLQVPFQIGTSGGVGFVTDPNVAAAQEIKAVIMTFLGERLMRPGIGNPFSMQVFNTTLNDADFINMNLMQALQQQVGRSSVESVNVASPGAGTWVINVQYTPLAFSGLRQSVEIPVSQSAQ